MYFLIHINPRDEDTPLNKTLYFAMRWPKQRGSTAVSNWPRASMPRLTFQQGCPGVIQIGLEEVGVLGWDDGELGAATINRALSMPKLVEVLADVWQV